jgi:hypothetical protein
MLERTKAVMVRFTPEEYERARDAQAAGDGYERWEPFATWVRKRLLRSLPPSADSRRRQSNNVTRRRRRRAA